MEAEPKSETETPSVSMRSRTALPNVLTSYDLLKTLALVLMILDHIGYYFFPYVPDVSDTDVLWFRVAGRMCVPIWFFLIGYARTTKVPVRLWLWAFAALLSQVAVGGFVFPLNILFTIAAARYIRDACARKTLESPEHMRGMVFLLLLGTLPTSLVVEYGAMVMMFVIYGYLRRNPEDVRVRPFYVRLFVFVAFFSYLFWQGATVSVLTLDQAFAMATGLGMVFLILRRFSPTEYPRLSALLGPFSGVLKLTGRRTLEIYVLHLILFRAAAVYFYPETHVFLGGGLMDPGLMSMIVPNR